MHHVVIAWWALDKENFFLYLPHYTFSIHQYVQHVLWNASLWDTYTCQGYSWSTRSHTPVNPCEVNILLQEEWFWPCGSILARAKLLANNLFLWVLNTMLFQQFQKQLQRHSHTLYQGHASTWSKSHTRVHNCQNLQLGISPCYVATCFGRMHWSTMPVCTKVVKLK